MKVNGKEYPYQYIGVIVSPELKEKYSSREFLDRYSCRSISEFGRRAFEYYEKNHGGYDLVPRSSDQ